MAHGYFDINLNIVWDTVNPLCLSSNASSCRWFHNPRLSDCFIDGFESALWKLSRDWLLMNRWGTE